jgi:hypothetical protein
MSITNSDGGDSPQFGPLVRRTAEGFIINEVSGDMAYPSLNNLDVIGSIGVTSHVSIQESATERAGGSALWKKMFNYFPALIAMIS